MPGENTMRKPKKKRRIPIPVKCFIALLVLLLICGFIFSLYMKQQTNPDNIINKYVTTFMSKDSAALFRFLGIEKNAFVNEETFARSLEECHKYSTISTYALTRHTDPAAPDEIRYNIKYWNGAHSKPYDQTVILKKSENKFYYFFDNWEIDCSGFFAKNTSVTAPAGASVMVDDVPLPDTQAKDQSGDSVTYEIGDLFTGTHEIRVGMDGFQDYSASTFLQNTDYKDYPLYTITASMLSVSKETENELAGRVENMIRALYVGVLQKDSFEELHRQYPFEQSSRISMEQKYDTLINTNIHSSSHLTAVEFSEFSSSCATAYAEDGCYAVKITTNADYTTTSVVVNNEVSQEKSTPGNSVFITTMHYKKGKWYIHDSTALESPVYYLKY